METATSTFGLVSYFEELTVASGAEGPHNISRSIWPEVGRRRTLERDIGSNAFQSVTEALSRHMTLTNRGIAERARPTGFSVTTEHSRDLGGRRRRNTTGSASNEAAFEIKNKLTQVFAPAIIGVGLIANCLCLAALQRGPLHRIPTVYFTSVAVADTLALLEYGTTTYTREHMEIALYTTHKKLCTVLHLLRRFSPTWSAWLVVAMTTERLLTVAFPLRLKLWWSRRKALLTVCALTVPLLGLWTFFSYAQDASMCRESKQEGRYEEVEQHVYLALYTGIPSPSLLMLNGLLVFQLVRARRVQRLLTVSPSVSISRVTVSTLLVSVLYTAMTLPSYVLGYYKTYLLGQATLSHAVVITSEVFKVFHYLNHALNFFLYLCLLPKFRAQLIAIITCGRRKPEMKGIADGKYRHSTPGCQINSTPASEINTRVSPSSGHG